MHYKTLEKLYKDYGEDFKQNAFAALQKIKTANPDFEDEDFNDISEYFGKQATGANQRVAMSKYDLKKGRWEYAGLEGKASVPKDAISFVHEARNPNGTEKLVFYFAPADGAPLRKGVLMEKERAEAFNLSFRVPDNKAVVEQLIPVE